MNASPPELPAYAELHCVSNFSFQRGASRPEELVERAHALGYAALAITDECSMAGVVRAHVAAKACGLHLLIGTEIRVSVPSSSAGWFRLVLLAGNRQGYGQLCELITAVRAGHPKGEYLATPEIVAGAGLRDVLALLVPRRETENPVTRGASFESIHAAALWLRATFPQRGWLAVELLLRPGDELWQAKLDEAGRLAGVPQVAAGDVHMHRRSRKPLQDVLTAVRLGRPVAECGFDLQPNAEAHLRPRVRLASLYPAALLAETVRAAALCRFRLDELRYEYPQELVPAGETPTSYLRRSTYEGAGRRYPQGVPAQVQALIEHELGLIEELGYERYFLTVFDVVSFARSRGILCQGRGSAANSAVCYCLGITEVDPARMSMLFERFISRERKEPPDIDVDFEHERREQVIQYLYRKYGRHRAALTAVVVSYRPRSAIRDVAKALGFDAQQVEALAQGHRLWGGMPLREEALAAAGLDPQDRRSRLLVELSEQLLGFPRQLSQHPGGFVLTGDRLTSTVPVVDAAMPERTTIEWDKDDIDALGLLKVDVLALGMLTAIRRTLDLMGQWQGRTWQLQDIPAEDPATYEMISAADTVGVFQIESRAQMSMLPRLRPQCFYDLVIEVALVRPGPIQGGMVHPYLRRRQGLEPVTYPGEGVRQALERTLGIPIFQEQVMQLCVVAAGFTPGEADALRRSMAAWRRHGSVEKFQGRIVQGMTERGYTREFAEQVFAQIQGFGEYGFPESHAASFALLVYASAWLKRHEPACFLAALLNSQPMGFYGPAQLVQDARRHGVQVHPPDVMHSAFDCTLEGAADSASPAVRLGLRLVEQLAEDVAQRIVKVRAAAPFQSTEDLALRVGLDAGDLKALASADALASLSGHRRQQVWDAAALRAAPALLRGAPVQEDLLELPPALEGEEVVFDYAATGLTLRTHPVGLLRGQLAARKLSTAAELRDQPGGRLVRACGLVTARQRPATANGTLFVSIEDETGTVNVIVWQRVRERYREPLLQARLLAVFGTWQREGEVRHLIAGHVEDLTTLLGGLPVASRDFR